MDEQRTHDSVNGNTETVGRTKVWRHLDHLPDMTRGTHYTQIPEPLRSAWYDRVIHPNKMRFIGIMLGHASEFHVKREYLDNRFDSRTIKKYLAELVEDGLLRLEDVRLPNGRPAVVHHVNPIRFWKLREIKKTTTKKLGAQGKGASKPGCLPVPAQGVAAQGVAAQGVAAQGVAAQGYNETSLNESNSNEKKRTVRGVSGYPQAPAKPEKGHSKWGLVGRIAALYDGKTKRVVFEGLVEQLQLLFKDKDIIALIEHYEDLMSSRDSELQWRASHTARWKKQIAEGYALAQSSNSKAPYRSHELEEEPGYA